MKPSGIGGQAVIEGVMMRNKDNYAVAVRTPDGKIVVNKNEYIDIGSRIKLFKVPVIRGMAAFVDSLIIGMKTLMFSASFFEDEEADKDISIKEKRRKARKESSAKKETIFMGITMTISIILAVVIFMLIPFALAELIGGRITSPVLVSLIEGVIRLIMFILYIKAISLMSDIKRVFMYHGAEHKVINCVENGLLLNVENAKKQTKEHKRCGTSFLLYVVLITFVVFVFIQTETLWLKVLLRLVLVPVIAGFAYEFIKLAGRSNGGIVNILSRPGMWLQRLTTKEPDDSMLEVAIASVEAVFDWREFQGTFKKNTSAFETIEVDDDEDELSDILDEADKALPESGEASYEEAADEDTADDGAEGEPEDIQETENKEEPEEEQSLEDLLKELESYR